MTEQRHPPQPCIDYDRLERMIGTSKLLMIKVKRGSDLDQYISSKMEAIQLHDHDSVMEYQALTNTQTRRFKEKYPLLFEHQNNSLQAYKTLFVVDWPYFSLAELGRLVTGTEYKQIFLLSGHYSLDPSDNRLIRAFIELGGVYLDAPLRGEVPAIVF